MSNLKTNYKDAELSPSMNGKRQYELQYNEAGYTNLVDKTAYTEVGDTFGADDINATNSAVNELNQNLTNYIPFPDYTKVITQGNINTSNNSMSSVAYTEYTAIEDCILCIHFTLIGTSKHGHAALVNDSIVYGRESDVAVAANCETECVLWLKKGDVVKMKALSNSNNSFYRVHGLR